jgi:hypothetical protein
MLELRRVPDGVAAPVSYNLDQAASGLQENHQRWDHIDHIVSAYGMFPVPPSEYDGHWQAEEQSNHQKSLLQRTSVTQAKGDPAEERRANNGNGRTFVECRTQQQIAKIDQE